MKYLLQDKNFSLLMLLTYLVMALFFAYFIIPAIINKKLAKIEPYEISTSTYKQHEIKVIDGYGRK